MTAAKKSCTKECQAFSAAVQAESGVVVTMPAARARVLASDPRRIYENYETLTDTNRRVPASTDEDKRRRGVSAILFGSYANEIRYGVLSLTGEGLPTYGDVHCRLKPVAVEDRVSFLEENSFTFVERHKVGPGASGPAGYRAVWDTRHLLAVAKLGTALKPGQSKQDWQGLMIHSDGDDRGKDIFIEAHIFGQFTIESIERMTPVAGRRSNKGTAMDIAIALELFTKQRVGSG